MANGDEKDILRSRLQERFDEDARQFVSSLKDDEEIAEVDVLGTMVHDYMLYKQGIITEREIKEILKELLAIKTSMRAGTFIPAEVHEDIHPAIESTIIAALGIDTGGKIHSGRSRNDQVALDIRLRARAYLLDLRGNMLDLLDVLVTRARATTGLPFPLYTHTQPAQAGTFAHLVMAWAFEITRHLERLEECFTRTNVSPLGACAIGGTSFPIDRQLVADLLGFHGFIENSVDAVSARDVLIENASTCASIAITFSRIAEDLVLYASHEFGYVSLPDRFCSVSSALPQKKNPDVLELIRALGATCTGALATQLVLAKGMPTGYNRDFQECKPSLFRVFSKLVAATRLLGRIIESTTVNVDAVRQSLARSDLVALDAAEYLCTGKGVPFRKSHEFMATLVTRTREQGRVLGIPLDEGAKMRVRDLATRVLGRGEIIDDGFFSVLERDDPHVTRRSAGSPAPASTERMLDALTREQARSKTALGRDEARVKDAENEFLDTARSLAGYS